MKRSYMFLALAVAATVITASVGSGATETSDLGDTGAVRVERSDGTLLPDVHVHQEGGRLAVWGMVSSSPLPGHVDVKVFLPDRKLITETQVVPTLVSRSRPSGVLWRFDAKLPVTPPVGAIVEIGYGFGQHETEQTAETGTAKK